MAEEPLDVDGPPQSMSANETLVYASEDDARKCAVKAEHFLVRSDGEHRKVVLSIDAAQTTKSKAWDVIVRMPVNIEREEDGPLYEYKTLVCWGTPASYHVSLLDPSEKKSSLDNISQPFVPSAEEGMINDDRFLSACRKHTTAVLAQVRPVFQRELITFSPQWGLLFRVDFKPTANSPYSKRYRGSSRSRAVCWEHDASQDAIAIIGQSFEPLRVP
jgi:hypothetical protein